MQHVELTIVGDNPPSEIPAARVIAATSDRATMAAIYSENDTLIFSSRVDYFPLTLAEALHAGLEVMALDSPAAQELAGLVPNRVHIFAAGSSIREAVEGLRGVTDRGSRPAGGVPVTQELFDPSRQARAYLDLYEEAASKCP